MSWKRAMAAGAKQTKHTTRNSARISERPNKCAAPHCSRNPTTTINGYDVCGRPACSNWAVHD